MEQQKQKLICVIGPTSAGKSELAVKLAKKYRGEIISADSRQIYRGLDIGTGKVEGQWWNNIYIYKDVPHYLIDEVSPKKQFSVTNFKTKADKVISNIIYRHKLPIICGGTMHWIDAVVFDQTFPEVKPNPELRKKLGKLNNQELLATLTKLDSDRALTIDNQNPRRLIRAIEIVKATGKPVPKQSRKSVFDVIWIGINPGLEQLEKNIRKRLSQRFKSGMVKEVQTLHDQGLSWKTLESFGLEYRFISQFLRGEITEKEMKEMSYFGERQYAKRQLTWWRRNKDIKWFKTESEALKNLRL